MGAIRLGKTDTKWLKTYFPNLRYDAGAQRIVGELDFCAAYDKSSDRLKFGCDSGFNKSRAHLCAVFEVEIRLDCDSTGENGWPAVYEVGGRFAKIAEKNNVEPIDLHFFEDGACCLGIGYAPEKKLTMSRLFYGLIIPFFYRLSFTERYGLTAARNELWGEYSHGNAGHQEHLKEMRAIAQENPGRNDPCPCGSGIKFKNCCQDEVNAVVRRLKPPISSKTG